jgi:hypothetical protein
MMYEPQSFERWRVPAGSIGQAQFEAVIAHPRFAAAARQLSRSMLDLAASDAALDGIMKDVGRFSAAGLAIYLDATGGLTLARMKELCALNTVVSPGRARALLLYLRFLRYVEPVESSSRAARFAPTPALTAAYHTIMRTGIVAATQIEPGLGRLSNRLGDTSVMTRYIRISGALGLSLARGPMDNALWRVFLNRHAGTQILHALMLASDDDAHYPPKGAIAFSLTGLARRFHVSRPHVARLLRTAEQEGLVVPAGEGRLAFTEAGRTAAAELLGVRLSNDLQAAIRLMDALDADTAAPAG